MADGTARCKRCGSSRVAWVQSARTGRYYLAFRVPDTSRSKGAVYRQIPHRCEEPNSGGYEACTLCGRHHSAPFGPRADWCQSYPDAP